MAKGRANLGGLLVVGTVVSVATAFALDSNDPQGKVQAAASGSTITSGGEPTATEQLTNSSESRRTNQNHATTNLQGEEMNSSIGMHGQVDHANDSNFREKVLDSSGRVLVDFYADWCGPCRMLAPVIEELAREEPTARIVKVNVDDSPHAAQQFGIESIPTLIVFADGRPVKEQAGLVKKPQLRDMLGLE